VVSSLIYPNLLGTKRLVVVVIDKIKWLWDTNLGILIETVLTNVSLSTQTIK
jgi:hypothetical protein